VGARPWRRKPARQQVGRSHPDDLGQPLGHRAEGADLGQHLVLLGREGLRADGSAELTLDGAEGACSCS